MPNQLPYGSDPFAGLYPEPDFAPEPVINPGPKTASGAKVFGVAAKQNVGGAAGGLLGAAGAGALIGTGVLGPVGTAGGFAVGLGGALLGSYLGSSAQAAVDPTYEEDAQWLAEQYPEHKIAAISGTLAPNLIGMRPSFAPLKQLRTIHGQLKQLPAGGRLGGNAWRNLTAEQQNALLNVGAGVGLGVAPTVNNLVHGRDVDVAELLAGVGSGALLTQPRGFMSKLGMHPSLAPEEEYQLIHDLALAKTLQDAPASPIPDQAIPQRNLAFESESTPLEFDPFPVTPSKKAERALLAQSKAAIIRATREQHAAELQREKPYLAMEDEGAPVNRPLREEDFFAAKAEESLANAKRDKALIDAEEADRIAAENLARIQAARKPSQAKDFLETGRAAIDTTLERVARENELPLTDVEQMAKDFEARYTGDKYSPGAEMRDEVPTLGEARAAEYLRTTNKRQTPEYHEAYAKYGKILRGVETKPQSEMPEAGKFTPRATGADESVIETGQGRGFGTMPHELTHDAADYLRRSPRTQDNRLHDLTIEAIKNDPKYQAWKAAADEQNARKGWKYSTEPEEYWAREAGAAKDLRIFDETPEVRNRLDREAATRVVEGTASVDDYVRYANNLMQYGPSFHTVMQRYGGKFGQLNAPIQQTSVAAQSPDEPELKVSETVKRPVVDDETLNRILTPITKEERQRVMDEKGVGRTRALEMLQDERAEAAGVGPQGFDVPANVPRWLKDYASGVSRRGAKKAEAAGKTREEVRGYGIEKPRSFQLEAAEKAKQQTLTQNERDSLLQHAFDSVKRKLSEENRKTGFDVKFDSYELDDETVVNPLRKSAEEGVDLALKGRWSENTKAAPNTPEFLAHLKDQAGKLAISRYRELRKAQVETMAGTKEARPEFQTKSVEADESLDATLAGEEGEAGVDYNAQTEVPQRTAAAEQRFSRQANEELGYRVSDQLKDTVARAVKMIYGEPPENVARLAREVLENTDYRYDNLVDALKQKNAPGTDKILKDLAEAIERQEFAQRDLVPQSEFVRLVQQWARANDMRDFGRGTRINDYNNLAYEIYNDPEMFVKFQDKVRAVGTQDDWNTIQDAIAIRKSQTASNRIAKERGEGVLAPRPTLHYRDEMVQAGAKPTTEALPARERTYEERGFKTGEELPKPSSIPTLQTQAVQTEIQNIERSLQNLREAKFGILNKEKKIAALERQLAKLSDALGISRPKTAPELDAEATQETLGKFQAKEQLRGPALRARQQIYTRAEPQYSPAAQVTDTPEFKKWFGDSKVVDKDGKPLVVYHGTKRDFETFDTKGLGTHVGIHPNQSNHLLGRTASDNARILPLYVAIKNPLRKNDLGGWNSPTRVLQSSWPKENLLFDKIKAQAFKDTGFRLTDTQVEHLNDFIAKADYNKYLNIVKQHLIEQGFDGIVYKNAFEPVSQRDPLNEEYADSYIVFSPEQIKSATGNSGAFDPSNPDIRYSISSMVPDLFKAEIDHVKRLDPDLGKAFERADRTRARLTGYLNNEPVHMLQNELALKPEGRDNKTFVKDLLANDSPDHRYVMWYRDQIAAGKKPNVTLTPRQQRINDAVELILKRTYDEREKNPLTKHDTKQTPGYLPGMMDLKIAREIEVNRGGKIAQDAIKAQEDWLAAKYGRGSKEFKDRMGRFLGAFDKKQMNSAEQFGPIDLNEGVGLAPELRDKNLNRLMSRFARRYAERMAFANEVQSDPKAMARLQDDKVSLKSNPHVKNVLDRMNGVREEQEEVRMAIGGAIRSMMLQTKTGLGDVTTSFPITMKHLSAKQLGGAGFAWARGAYEGLTRKGDLFRETLRQGVNVDNSVTMEMGEDGAKNLANALNGVRNITNKATGRNWLEQISRTGVYEEGKWLATENVKAVLDGTANAQQKKFVDDFFDKPEFTPEAIREAATRFVEVNQGTYGYRGLPSISEKGSLAPFLSLSRWNIEQLNNFDKFVFKPALKGNYEPLLMATLGALIGGAAVEQLYEIVSNRKSRLPTVSEIGASKQPVKGTLYKLAGLASLSGFAGFYGDIARTIGDKSFGNRAQGLTNPMWNGMQDFADIASDFVMAVADGNVEDAATQLLPVLLQTYVQDARLLMAHADDDEMKRRDSFRDVRMFNALNEGEVTPAIADQPNPFTNVGLRKFKKTSDLNEAAGLLPGLLEGAVGRSGGDPEKIEREFGKIKANSYQTMPSLSRRPLEFARYMEYLTKTQGPEAAAERFVDYQKQNAINQAKTAMVP